MTAVLNRPKGLAKLDGFELPTLPVCDPPPVPCTDDPDRAVRPDLSADDPGQGSSLPKHATSQLDTEDGEDGVSDRFGAYMSQCDPDGPSYISLAGIEDGDGDED